MTEQYFKTVLRYQRIGSDVVYDREWCCDVKHRTADVASSCGMALVKRLFNSANKYRAFQMRVVKWDGTNWVTSPE